MVKQRLIATQTADICKVNRNTVNRYYNIIRKAILTESIVEAKKEIGEYELEESYFEARRGRGKRGRGAAGKSHVNGIENFWSFAKRRLAKFNGFSSSAFVLHLKEYEWRYNHRNDDLLALIKKLYKKTYLDQ